MIQILCDIFGRHKQLENILVVAQQFHDTLEPLTEWLTATEKRLANSEPIGTQTARLQEQISQHKVQNNLQSRCIVVLQPCVYALIYFPSYVCVMFSIHVQLIHYFLSVIMVSPSWFSDIRDNQTLEEEVMGRSKMLCQAMSLGQSLRMVSCVDDKELVQAKLDNTQSGYIELQEHCHRRSELLQQALANARVFGQDEVALLTWLDEVHSKLNDISVQDYTTSVLAKQHAELLVLQTAPPLRRFVVCSVFHCSLVL